MVIVPIFVSFYQKRIPHRTIMIGALFATAGLALLSIGPNFTINSGDPIVLICAFCFAAHIFFVGKFAPEVNATVLASFQILTVALLSGVGTLLIPQPQMIFSSYVWFGLILTALICTSAAFFIQSKMQQFTSASHTAIIFASEPVFAAIFAFLLAGEMLSVRGFVGAGFVLAGILIAEFRIIRKIENVK